MNALINNEVSVDFVIGEDTKTFTFAELSVKQVELFQRKVQAAAKRLWAERLNAIAQAVDPKERWAFLQDAAKTEPDLSEERRTWISSNDGLREACLLSCPAISKYWDEMAKVEANTEPLIKAWQCAMGIKENIKPEEVREELPLAPIPS